MNDIQQQELGKALWAIADKLRGAMNADDFRDYMLSFLFLRYLVQLRNFVSLQLAAPSSNYLNHNRKFF